MASATAREEMFEVRRICRDLFMETLLYEQVLDPLTMEVPCMTEPMEEDFGPLEVFNPLEKFDLMESLEGSDQVALWLAFIGDEMDLHLRSHRLAQLPGMAMKSLALALTCDQTGIRGLLRSFVNSLSNLRKIKIRFWRSLSPRTWVLLPGVLLLVLLLYLLLK
ncbi:bcl-2-interacting killer-like [Cynocephalus volans]|uniref:bcl-2-interacting killer-like n=1 Tax=Cynocephalus volans TaxID=110931 RepID=UPI002FCA41C7